MKRSMATVREVVTSSQTMTSLLKPAVDSYRWLLSRVGGEIYTLDIDGVRATFTTETFEEVKHFHPVVGERPEIRDLLGELRADDVFYDVGAHIGIYACIVGQTLPEGDVLAFEPHPGNVSKLEANLDRNDVDATVYPYALSDESGTVQLSVDALNSGSIGHLNPDKRDRTVDVKAIRGDGLVAEEGLEPPTVVKVDVEGAELKVLRGLDGCLDRCRLLYCEVSPALEDYGDSKAELYEFLEARGFETERIEEGDAIDHHNLKAYRDRDRQNP